jgi:hypothetical protein
LNAENSKSSIEPTQSQLAEAEMISSVDQAEKADPEKAGLQAIAAVTSPDQVVESSEPHDSPRRPPPPNPYQKKINRKLFYFVCFYFCLLELGAGISTGLSPYFLILWALSKGLSYLGMVVNRIFRLRKVYVCAFDLPRFCDRPPKVPSEPEKLSPEKALEILTLMMPDPKQDGMGKFDTDDLNSMKELLKSLREKASQEIAAEGGARGAKTTD